MSASTQLPNTQEPASKPIGRLLVVDDDVDFAESLANLMKLRGYTVKVTHDSSCALALAKTFDPDVALIDIRLGRENGLNLIADLKERHPGIDCILITAHADLDTAIEAVWRNVYDYLLKPLDDDKLMISLDRCFEKRRLEREKEFAEAELVRSKERYRDFTKASSDWAWEMDARLRLTRLVGYSDKTIKITEENLIGKTRTEIGIRGIDKESTARLRQATKERRAFRDTIGTMLTPDGSVRYINVSGKPVFADDGEFLGYRGTANDVTPEIEAKKQAERTHQRLLDSIESIPAGFLICDVDDRIVLVNSAFGKWMTKKGRAKLTEGMRFEDYLGRLIDRGLAGEAGKNPKKWLKQRLAAHRNPDKPVETHFADGSIIQAIERKTSDGGTVSVFFDVTEHKTREDELERARADLRMVLENVDQGISKTDANMVNTVFNDKFLELLDFPKDKFKPGDAFEKFIRFNAERGEYGEGDVEQMLHDRVELAKEFAPHHFERVRPNGQVLEIRGNPVPGGGFVTTYTDVTERRQAEQELRKSEERIRGILENVADGVITIDEKGKIESFNPAAEAMFGYAAEEIVGHAISNLMIGTDRRRHQSYIRNYFETGQSNILNIGGRELKARRKDGSVFSIELTVGEMRIGERRFFIGAVRDIAKRKRAERAVRESEQRFRSVIDASPLSFMFKDLDGRIRLVNKAYLEMFQTRLEDVIGYTSFDLYPRDVAEAVESLDREALEKQTVVENELEAEVPDGTVHTFVMTKFPVQLDGEEPIGIGSIALDITAYRKTEDQLRQAQKMEAVGQLTGGIAHDFNNILGIVLGNLELTKEKAPSDGEVARRLDISIGATKRAATLVARLLAFARKQTLTPTVTDVAKLISGMQDMLQRTLGEMIEVEVTHPGDCWPALVDPAQLESAVLNLAINARDAMRKGGKLTIEIGNAVVESDQQDLPTYVTPDRYLSIKVVDTGSGMAPEVLERIFDPFYTTKAMGEGSGLGLSMTYGFVKQTKGYIWIDSEKGKGSIVTIYLPRAEYGTDRAAQAEPSIAASSRSNKTVLVVEDNGELRRLVTMMLDNLGYEAIGAGTAEEALKLLERTPRTEFLLTDIVLAGGMSGPKLAQLALQQNPTLSILYMSGYPDRNIDIENDAGESARVLSKPFRKDDLARALLNAIGRQGAG